VVADAVAEGLIARSGAKAGTEGAAEVGAEEPLAEWERELLGGDAATEATEAAAVTEEPAPAAEATEAVVVTEEPAAEATEPAAATEEPAPEAATEEPTPEEPAAEAVTDEAKA
jgi:small subunit ribosomal protein S2